MGNAYETKEDAPWLENILLWERRLSLDAKKMANIKKTVSKRIAIHSTTIQ